MRAQALSKHAYSGPGQVAHLVRASSLYAKVAGSIPSQGTDKNQPMNPRMGGGTNPCFSLSLKTNIKNAYSKTVRNP